MLWSRQTEVCPAAECRSRSTLRWGVVILAPRCKQAALSTSMAFLRLQDDADDEGFNSDARLLQDGQMPQICSAGHRADFVHTVYCCRSHRTRVSVDKQHIAGVEAGFWD